MADEQEKQIPPASSTNSSPASNLSTLRQYTENKQLDTAIAINGAAPPQVNSPIKLPVLPESTHTTYKSGKASQAILCSVGNILLEKNTAYDFIMMANTAAKAGVTLKINEGFRTWEEQDKKYKERSNPAVAAERGKAARPGYSNHQTGQAVDIKVNMSPAMFIAEQKTPEFVWLEKNAAKFGFDHTEGASIDEPWHWTHPKKEIVGSQAFQNETGFTVLVAETAVAATSSNQSGVQRTAKQEMHDKTVGVSRAIAMPNASRSTLSAAQSLFCAYQSNGSSHDVSQGEVATLETEPVAFSTETLGEFSYNFLTGLWGDGETV